MDDYALQIDIKPERDIAYQFVSLSSGGRLTIRKTSALAWISTERNSPKN